VLRFAYTRNTWGQMNTIDNAVATVPNTSANVTRQHYGVGRGRIGERG
jgi:hypothetical protein